MKPQATKAAYHRRRQPNTNKKSHKTSKLKGRKNPKFECPVCQKTSQSRSNLEEHLRVHTGERPFACKICNMKFQTARMVTLHSTVHTGERPFVCIWCDKSFRLRCGLMNHLRGHTRERPFWCKKCPDTFTNVSGLNSHILKKHESGKGRKCEYCAKSFYIPSALKIHLRQHTGEKPYSCLVCGKSFSQKILLTIHSGVHSESRPFKCSKCPKAFRFQTNLHSHTKFIHDKVLAYPCGICGKPHTTKAARDAHTSSHLKEKPHKCPKCSKRFAYRHGVVYHLKAFHENRRDFKCSKCPLSFVDHAHREGHFMKMHADPSEKPLGCLFCTKRFCMPHQFENHLRTHTLEKPFFCQLCPYTFAAAPNLNTHLRKMHKFDSSANN